ncbi:lipocalin family protein [Flavobacteriaceae bacterium]|nr:lipocalin family protein [Flavobacteriaceae bacterium]
MRPLITLLCYVLINSCQSDVTTYVPFVEGYWEIVSVTKDQNKVKDYKMSGSIDYFKVNADLSGYRKKMTPRFDGVFEMSLHVSEFTLSVKGNHLMINYTNNGVSYSEEIIRANKASLVISNADGFIYTYKPYEPLTFE